MNAEYFSYLTELNDKLYINMITNNSLDGLRWNVGSMNKCESDDTG